MSTYSVAQVEAITGINAHTLRIWERRYSFLNPMRTDTNIRYYDDSELRKLICIGLLQRNGFRISKLDKMASKEISTAIEDLLESSDSVNEDEINRLMLSMLNFDEKEFNKIFQRQLIQKGLLGSITDVIYPFLYKLGVFWGVSKVIPAQEHFISNLIRQKLLASIDALPVAEDNASGLLMFLDEEEHHELGLLLSSFVARSLGWRVIYLGQAVPSANIRDVIELVNVDYMMTMLISPRTDDMNILLQKIMEDAQKPLIISGKNEFVKEISDKEMLIKIDGPDELIALLKEGINNRKS